MITTHANVYLGKAAPSSVDPAGDIDVNSFKEGVIQTTLSDASTDQQIPTAAATVSYVGGVISNYTTTAELSLLLEGKVDKVTTTGGDRVYGITSEGAQTVYPLPTVGNGTITLTQGGVSKGSFTVNQSSDTTIDFDEGTTVELAPNLSIIGSPTINSGNVSNFSDANYMQFPFALDFTNVSAIEMVMEFTTGADVTTQQNVLDSYYGLAFAVLNGNLVLSLSSNGTSWDIGSATGTATIEANTTYHAKLSWDGADYTLDISTDGGQTYTNDITINSSVKPNITAVYVGGSPNLYGAGTAHPFGGALNLNGWSILRNSLPFWVGMDDIGLDTRANVDLTNLSGLGEAKFNAKQDLLESGVNIKTVGGQTMLGSGDIPLPSGGASAYLFQHQWSDHILTEDNWLRADTFDWHSGVTYPDAYNELVSEYNDPDATNDALLYYKVIGSPTIIDYVASNFTTSSYVTSDFKFSPASNPWKVKTKITAKTSSGTTYFFNAGTPGSFNFLLGTGNLHFYLWVSSNGTSHNITNARVGSLTLTVDTDYWLEFGWTGTEYFVDYSTDGETFVRDITVASTTAVYNSNQNMSFGHGWTTAPTPCYIDLNQTSYELNGSLVWQAVVDYKITPKGYYIITSQYLPKISDIYTSEGKELFYVLDTANTRFKLPRVGLTYSYFYGSGEPDPLASPATLADTLPMANADLSNVSAGAIASGISPDYSAGVSLTSYTSSSNQFTAPCNGIIYTYSQYHYLNGVACGSTSNFRTIFMNKGDKYYATSQSASNAYQNVFFPFKGAS